MEYNYPIDYSWTTKEIIIVINLYNAVEKAYETGINKIEFMEAYRKFKEVVPGKSEEKKLDREFYQVSNYSIYQVVKAAKEQKDFIRVGD